MKLYSLLVLVTFFQCTMAFAGRGGGTNTGNAAVPEPGSLVLLGVGLLAFVVSGIFKRKP